MLQKEKRRLLFYSNSTANLECMDLRKARCLVLKDSDDSIRNLHVSTGPTMVIDCPPYTMYFVFASSRETKVMISIKRRLQIKQEIFHRIDLISRKKNYFFLLADLASYHSRSGQQQWAIVERATNHQR